MKWMLEAAQKSVHNGVKYLYVPQRSCTRSGAMKTEGRLPHSLPVLPKSSSRRTPLIETRQRDSPFSTGT